MMSTWRHMQASQRSGPLAVREVRPTAGRSAPIMRSTAYESQRTSSSGPARSLIAFCRSPGLSPPRSSARGGCCMTLDPKSELTRQWLQVANDDLALAVAGPDTVSSASSVERSTSAPRASASRTSVYAPRTTAVAERRCDPPER